MEADTNKADARYWSPYWANPTVTSFGALFPNNYDGVMLDFWRRQCALLAWILPPSTCCWNWISCRP